jgi:hypothetical protein
MKRSLRRLFLSVFSLGVVALAGVGSDKTSYVGGTESQVQEGEGAASIGNEKEFVYEYANGQLIIPYDQVTDLEYGQRAGRRVGLAIAVNPLLLLSKKRRHFLTIGWKDQQSKQHAAVFELGKSIIRRTITTLEEKTGKKVEYQDDDARKSGNGGM